MCGPVNTPDVASKHLLLVEDDALIAITEKRTLEKHGFAVTTVNTGEKAVETIAAGLAVDLILMDIDLGSGMDGTQAAETILDTHDVPIVFLTSHAEKEYVDRVKKITGYGYVLKSSGEFVLVESINMAFKLREAYTELERYFTSSLDMLCIATTEGEFVRLNPEWERVLGYTVRELEGRRFIDLVHEDDRERTLAALSRLGEQEEVLSFENRYRCKDGSYRWIEWRSRPIGSTIYAAARDITDRKQAEQTVRHSEERFQRMLGVVPDLVSIHDPQMNILYSNWKGFGAVAEEKRVLNTKCYRTYRGYEDICPECYAVEALRTGRAVEAVAELPDGTWVDVRSIPITNESGNAEFFVEWVRDITEHKRLEQDYSEREKYFHLLTDSVQDVVMSVDLESESPIYASPSVERVLGYSADEVCSMTLRELQTEDSYARHKQKVRDVVEKGEAEPDVFEREVFHKTGRIVPLEIHSTFIPDETGTPKQSVAVLRDITARKKKERELEQMSSRLQTVVDSIPFVINELDISGRYLLSNETTCRLLGMSKEQLKGKHFSEVLPANVAQTFEKRIKQVQASGEQLTVDDRLEFGGQEQVFRTVLSPVLRDDNTVQSIVGIGYDVSNELKALQHKDFLMREVNHRVKNHLNMVSGLITLKDAALGGEVDLSDLRSRIEAISKMHQLLQQGGELTQVNLKEYVSSILSSVFSSRQSRSIAIENDLPDIVVGAGAAVPLALIVNETATNAFKYGFDHETEPRFTVAMEQDGNEHYILTISNTGKAFPDEVDVENPKTLGLQLIAGLVSELQGSLEMQRKPQPVFKIRLPADRLLAAG